MNALWMRQIAGVFRLEWKKTFFSRRGWWIYCLAAGPMFLTFVHWMVEMRGRHNHSLGDDSLAFAAMFQFFFLRGAIFFGSVGVFCNLFRAEMLEKTLHYYYLTPVRREVLVAGKYLAGLAMAVALFVTSVASSFLMIGRHAGQQYTDYIMHGPGLGQLGWYVLITVLACIGYGAVFLMCGIFFRNPMIPAAVVFVWENLNPFLPTLLKKISVIFYLRNLCPVEVPLPPPLNAMVIDADPTPAWLAVFGLVTLSAMVLAYSAHSARSMEISYGE